LFCSKILQTLNPNLLQAWEAMTFFYKVPPPKEKKKISAVLFVCVSSRSPEEAFIIIIYRCFVMLCYVVL
jgi:hypothetical protein